MALTGDAVERPVICQNMVKIQNLDYSTVMSSSDPTLAPKKGKGSIFVTISIDS